MLKQKKHQKSPQDVPKDNILAGNIPRNILHAITLDQMCISQKGHRISFYEHSNRVQYGQFFGKGKQLEGEMKGLSRVSEIHKWKGIRSFTLDVVKTKSRDQVSWKHIKFQKFDQLLVLEINLNALVAAEDLEELSLLVSRNLTNLTELKIYIPGFVQLTGKELDNFLYRLIKPLHKLTTLKLVFAGVIASNERFLKTLSRVTKCLGSQKQIRLELSFHSSQLTDKVISTISSGIKKYLQNVQQFELYIGPEYLSCKSATDESLKELAIQLGKLICLRKLALHLERLENIGDPSINSLGNEIATNLKDLNSLTLNFTECQKVTREAVNKLGNDICENLSSLQHLAIHCPNLRQNDLIKLKEKIENHLIESKHSGINN